MIRALLRRPSTALVASATATSRKVFLPRIARDDWPVDPGFRAGVMYPDLASQYQLRSACCSDTGRAPSMHASGTKESVEGMIFIANNQGEASGVDLAAHRAAAGDVRGGRAALPDHRAGQRPGELATVRVREMDPTTNWVR